MEECGIDVTVGQPCLVNEFHDPQSGFHQVEIYFHCFLKTAALPRNWIDREGTVTERRFFSREELKSLHYKPDSLGTVTWEKGLYYDPLEIIVS